MTEDEINVLVESLFLPNILENAERPVVNTSIEGAKCSITYLTPIGKFNLILTNVE